MLSFHYTFLILVLSSVPAWPHPFRQDDGVAMLLISNMDERLSMGLWGRVRATGDTLIRDARMSAEEEDTDDTSTWTDDGQYLDDALHFVRGTGPRPGVQEVELRRIVRKLMPNQQQPRGPRRDIIQNQYLVVRSLRVTVKNDEVRPAETRALLDPPSLPIIHCRSYLHDTYWGRNPDVLGRVSDSLMIWKS
jgi:hypothetical protein